METLLTHGPTVLLFIVVLAVLVLVHELGHYLAARYFGIDVEEFGIGFPPRAWSVKKGKTIWSVNWIPLGGFVRIKGEDDPSATGPGNFAHKPAYQRAIVICAGVFMNLVLSSLLFAVGFTVGLPQIAEGLPASARVRDPRVQIIEVLPESPAAEAGFAPGDVILKIEGEALGRVEDIQARVNAAEGSVDVELKRGKEILTKELVPKLDEESGRKIMGVALVESAIVSYPWYHAIGKGIYATGFYVKEIVLSLADLIKGLFVGQKPGVEFSGPVGIAVLTGQAAKLGLTYLMQFAALLSVNLAVINILPIPALDGGRLLFIIIEKFRGRSVRPIVEAVTHRIAFFLLLGLVVLVTIKDLTRYREQIFEALKGLFGVV
ncbi:MAG: RIP metalloprotease RseP [Patescibacteria group bacterium]